MTHELEIELARDSVKTSVADDMHILPCSHCVSRKILILS